MAAIGSKRVTIKAEVLDDVSSRFLINLSNEERDDPIKLCSHIELAHWYYLDLMRPEDLSLPGCNLKEFMATILQHCPWLVRGATSSTKDLEKLIADWKLHKYSKPVRGAILLNLELNKCLLVQGYPSHTAWTFPKGKLEEGETDKDAAVREVFEETGFDIRVLIQKSDFLEACIHDSNARMYIITGVSESTRFEAKTRKEIRSIQWFKINDLPSYKKDQTSRLTQGKGSNFFTVIPFIGQLRRWIQQRRSKGRVISASFKTHSQPSDVSNDGHHHINELLPEAQGSTVTPNSTSKVQAGPSAPSSSAVRTAGQGFRGSITPVRGTAAALIPRHQLIMTGPPQPHRVAAPPLLSSAAAGLGSHPLTPPQFSNIPQHFQPVNVSQQHQFTPQLFQPAAGPRVHHMNPSFGQTPQPFQPKPPPQLLQPAAGPRAHPAIPQFVNAPRPFQPLTAVPFHQARSSALLLQPTASSSAHPSIPQLMNIPQPFQPSSAVQFHQVRSSQPLQLNMGAMATPQHLRPAATAPSNPPPLMAAPMHTLQHLSAQPSAVLYNLPRPQPTGPLQEHLHSPSPRHALLPTPQLATAPHLDTTAPLDPLRGKYGPSVAQGVPVAELMETNPAHHYPLPPVAQQSLLLRPPAAGLSRGPLLPAPSSISSANPSSLAQPKHPQWNQQGWRDGMGTANASMSLHPVASLVGFRFNKEAILHELRPC